VQAIGPARQVMTKALVDRLYDTDVDILPAPGDGAPVIVPRRRTRALQQTTLREHPETEGMQ